MKPLLLRGSVPVMLIFLVVMAGFVKESKAFTCASTFFASLVQLIPCKPAVAPYSTVPPNQACCTAVKSLGKSCLCVLINGPPISGVDRSMALQLPDKCNANFEPCEVNMGNEENRS